MTTIDVRESAKRMLKTEIMTGGNNIVFNGDDYQSSEIVSVGDTVYLDCAFYDDGRGYIWEIKGQTVNKSLLVDAPTPSDGATAVVECEVVGESGGDKVKLNNPTVIEFNMNENTAGELEDRL